MIWTVDTRPGESVLRANPPKDYDEGGTRENGTQIRFDLAA
jgi:hypothetical protein